MPVAKLADYKPSDKSLLEQSIEHLQQLLTPGEAIKKKDDNNRTVDRISLASFVEATSNIILEPWQIHLCERLEKLTYQKGQRILIHKPPQHGGSVIVSQRLPAYLLGDEPTKRERLACYNIDHATKFTGINKTIMQSAEYKALFPNPDLVIPNRTSDAEFYTPARKRLRDAQSSLMALGLITGFVGQGADDLIIDDPYPSPQAAESKAIRDSTWTFWIGSAKVRIDQNTNVVVMFHRYNEDDFAGQLIKEEGLISEGGTWELICYRAEWDGDERLEVGGKDPMNRVKGQYLSERKASQPGYYEGQKRNPRIWNGQFQGKPSGAEGSFFLINQLRIIPKMPCAIRKICRAWDIASSTDGDYTVGVLMALGIDEYIYVLDVVRIRENTDARNRTIRLTAQLDHIKYPDVKFRFPQDPAAAGKDLALAFTKLMKGFDIEIATVSGDKEVRADPWSGYMNAGLVRLVYKGDIKEKNDKNEYVSWVPEYVEEHRVFPNKGKKDQVDASSDAFSELALEIENEPGQDFDTVGLAPGEDNTLLYVTEDSEEQMLAEIAAYNLGYNGYIGSAFDLESNDTEGVFINGKVYNVSKSQTTSSIHKERATSPLRLSTIRQRQDAKKAKTRGYKPQRPNSY